MICPNCGETMIGDGYRTPIHCPNTAEDVFDREPDSAPLLCPLIHVSVWKKKRPGAKVPTASSTDR